jgi:hypothetical protein
MKHDERLQAAGLGRRGLLAAVGAAGLAAAAPSADAAPRTLPLTAQATEGPYYIDVAKVRSDVTEGLDGVPLEVRFTVLDTAGKPLRGLRVDLWHCDAQGRYSGFGGHPRRGHRGRRAQAGGSRRPLREAEAHAVDRADPVVRRRRRLASFLRRFLMCPSTARSYRALVHVQRFRERRLQQLRAREHPPRLARQRAQQQQFAPRERQRVPFQARAAARIARSSPAPTASRRVRCACRRSTVFTRATTSRGEKGLHT